MGLPRFQILFFYLLHTQTKYLMAKLLDYVFSRRDAQNYEHDDDMLQKELVSSTWILLGLNYFHL